MTPLLELAERIARQAHAGQIEELTGGPYIDHVARVVALVDGTDAKAVAWLHDVVEDNAAWPLRRLEAEGVSAHVCTAVGLLTRPRADAHGRAEMYAGHIREITVSGDPLAIAVKAADLIDHLRVNCPQDRRVRYERALMRLVTWAF